MAFRKSATDGTPMIIIPLGEREASVSIVAFQREFGIADDSADGLTLLRVLESLNHVATIAPGDRFPREVVDGSASWDPEPRHLQIASARLRRQLLTWLQPDRAKDALSADGLLALDDDPDTRAQIQTAFAKAAEMLGLAGPSDIIAGIEQLATELAYIEALRERLLLRVEAMRNWLMGLHAGRGTDFQRGEMLQQVVRLCGTAFERMEQQFREVDAQTGEVIAALRNADSQRSFIRSNRDLLHAVARAWETTLDDWTRQSRVVDAAGETMADQSLWAFLGRAYHFLAPRYMPVHEWQAAQQRSRRAGAKPPLVMTW